MTPFNCPLIPVKITLYRICTILISNAIQRLFYSIDFKFNMVVKRAVLYLVNILTIRNKRVLWVSM
jgi:hypothetical protein